MRHSSLKPVHSVYALTIAMMTLACSKDHININLDSCCSGGNSTDTSTSGSGSGSSSSKLYVDFTPYVITQFSSNPTGTTPLAANRLVTVYTYSNGSLYQTTNYESETAGSLTPVPARSPLEVTTGIYNFYAVGVNATTENAPAFAGGVATNLLNNKDYIEWYSTNNNITSNKDMTINFSHLCAQVVLKVDTTAGSGFVSLNSPTVTPTDPTPCSWNLLSGVISPSSTLLKSSPLNLGVNGIYAQAILLPLTETATDSIVFNFGITYKGSSGNVTGTYRAPFAILDNRLKPGTSYLFQVKFANDTISFPTVNIINWIDVDNGAPIIPTPI